MGIYDSPKKSSNITNNSDKAINISSTSPAILSTNPNTTSLQKSLFNVSIDEAKQFLLNVCNISPFILDDKGTTNIGWLIGITSGPPGYLKDFIPPIGWLQLD